MPPQETPIFSEAISVQKLFQDRRFQLPYYQREYTWRRRNLLALLGDLRRRYLSQPNTDESGDITQDTQYFLGSLVTYDDAGRTYLVDGQQRVTTLHLLLIRLHRLLCEQDLPDDAARLVGLIWYERGIFTIDIEERADLLGMLTRGERPIKPDDATPSVSNIHDRAIDLLDDFPPDLLGDELRPFVSWLLNRVCVVVVRAVNKEHGWEIFETINHRGVQPSSLDLLKGYLLAQAGGAPDELNTAWRGTMTRLFGISPQAPGEFVRDLIVGRLLEKAAEGSTPETTLAFPEWIRANAPRLGLRGCEAFRTFVTDVFLPLAERYASLRSACAPPQTSQSWSAAVAFNHYNDMPYHLAAVLAAVAPADDDTVFQEKTRLVAGYLDLTFVRLAVNGKVGRATEFGRIVRDLIPALRNCASVEELRALLARRVQAIRLDFHHEAVAKFALRHDNYTVVRYILARLTSFTETSIGHPDRVAEYLRRDGDFDIEHIWPNDSKQQPEVTSQLFRHLRNRLGALLLLRRVDNRELGHAPYPVKIEVYRRQNALAASLHPAFRERHPGFATFGQSHGIEGLFRPFPVNFPKHAINTRQALYQRLCSIVWHPARLGLGPADDADTVLASKAEQRRVRPSAEPLRTGTPTTEAVVRLIRRGVLHADQRIQATRGGVTCVATVLGDGSVELETGEVFPDIVAAGKAAFGVATFRGWDWWHCERDGSLVKLGKLRDIAIVP